VGFSEGSTEPPETPGGVRRSQTVFADEHALIIADPEHSADETRLVLLGMSARLRILVVVHVFRMAPETIRIISARRATKAERDTYAKRLQP
jgi:uncharacterized DUF497 family protein